MYSLSKLVASAFIILTTGLGVFQAHSSTMEHTMTIPTKIGAGASEVVKKKSPMQGIKLANNGAAFAGCVHSHNQCHHLATHNGRHHAKVIYNANLCHHHPHYACYVW